MKAKVAHGWAFSNVYMIICLSPEQPDKYVSNFLSVPGIYLTVTMGMTSLSIILTVFVLQLHYVGPHQRRVPKWLQILSHDILARLLCLRPRVNPFLFTSIHHTDPCLSSYLDTLEQTNCNGVVIQKSNHVASSHNSPRMNTTFHHDALSHERLLAESTVDETQDKITNSLKVLVAKQDLEERHQDVVNEWRFVAGVMDRFLFFVFLLAAFLSSIVILVIKPMEKPPL